MGKMTKPWGLYHRAKKGAPERLFSKHIDRLSAENAKWDQLGMGGYRPGELFIIRRRPDHV